MAATVSESLSFLRLTTIIAFSTPLHLLPPSPPPWYRAMGAPAPALLAALVALALLHLQPTLAGPLAVPCETLTGLNYCTECARPAGAAKPLCYLCHPNRASVWKTDGSGTVSQVGAGLWTGHPPAAAAPPPPADGGVRRALGQHTQG